MGSKYIYMYRDPDWRTRSNGSFSPRHGGIAQGSLLIERGWLLKTCNLPDFFFWDFSSHLWGMPWKVLRGMEKNKNQKPKHLGFGTVLLEWQREFRALYLLQSADPDFSCFWLCPRSPIAWATLPCKTYVQLVWNPWDIRWCIWCVFSHTWRFLMVMINGGGGVVAVRLSLSKLWLWVCMCSEVSGPDWILPPVPSQHLIIPQNTILILLIQSTLTWDCMAVFTKGLGLELYNIKIQNGNLTPFLLKHCGHAWNQVFPSAMLPCFQLHLFVPSPLQLIDSFTAP